MKIRRVQYDVEFSHILTFQEEYRSKIASVFTEHKLRYGLENTGTIDESIKLVFTDLTLIVHCSKGALRMVYEGDPRDFIRGGSPQWDVFMEIFNSIKQISGFGYLTRHSLQAIAVKVLEKEEVPCELNEGSLSSSKYIKFSPYQNYNEFGLIYENVNVQNEDFSKITFGNYSFSDIQKFDITPFESEYNEDLFTNVGYMADAIIKRPFSSFSKTSFKDILKEVEDLISKFED